MSEVKRFTRTCDCVTEAPYGEYVLHADFDAEHALRLEAERELSFVKEISRNGQLISEDLERQVGELREEMADLEIELKEARDAT